MAYVNNIHNIEGYKIISGFGNTFVCDKAIDANKTITFPDGWDNDTNLSFKVIFKYGHICADDQTHMTLNSIPIVVNQYGILIPLPIHEMNDGGPTVYKSLQPNTILEMYYTNDYDGNNNSAYVVIGNPIVLSSTDYTIYADGKVGEEPIGAIKETLNTAASYGWLLCQGQTLSRTADKKIYDWVVANNLLEQTAGDGKPFGLGDGSTTFTNIDLRGEFLRGAGKRGNDTSNYVGSNVGEHQDATWIPYIYHYASGWNGFNVVDIDSDESVITLNYDSYDMASVACDMERGSSKARDDKKGGTVRPINTSVNYMIKVME